MAGGARSAGGLARSLEGYAALVRVPNLFTAPPDVLLGAALAAGTGAVAVPAAAGLAVASMLLYAGGTALNDAFDAPRDAVERPERPIPSGRVSRRTGFGLGGACLLGGVALAGLAAGAVGAGLAALVALAVVAYDGALKGGAVGFAAMGAARGLNVLLGTAAADAPRAALSPATLGPAVAVTVYIAAVTYMASTETQSGDRAAVLVAGLGAVAAGLAVGARLVAARPGAVATAVTLALGAAFLWWTGRALVGAYRDPVPSTVGPAVGACILALVVLDAAFAATVGVGWAVAALAFLIPAVGLQRRFSVS